MPHNSLAQGLVLGAPTYPMVPESVKPDCCRKAGCEFALETRGKPEGAFAFIHRTREGKDEYIITAEAIDDTSLDLWDQVKPWIIAQHHREV